MPNSNEGPAENDEEPVLAGPSLPSPSSCPSFSALVYMSRYCVSAVPGVGGTDDVTGAGAGAISVSLFALSRSTAREGRSESVRRGASVVWLDRVEEEAALLPPSRGMGRASCAPCASVSSVWLRGGEGGRAVVDRLMAAGVVVVRVFCRPRMPAGVTGTGGGLTPLEVG